MPDMPNHGAESAEDQARYIMETGKLIHDRVSRAFLGHTAGEKKRKYLCALSAPQLHALKITRKHGQITITELADTLGVSPPSASAMMDRLVEKGVLARQRLKILDRNKELARDEYARFRRLYTENDVGTRSGVDGAEQAYNLAADQAEQMAQAVAVYPIQIREQEHRLASEKARVDMARTNLARCTAAAPFDGRIKDVSLETGRYVAHGQPAVILADDSVLEMHVPLDSRDAAK